MFDAAGAMTRDAVSAPLPLSVNVGGVNRHVSPAGRPPVQANVMVEWKPPEGVAVSVMAPEAAPVETLTVGVEVERLKLPTGATTISEATAEVLERCAVSPRYLTCKVCEPG